ncbi:MAG: helicase-related protein [Actinomycetota bacterium]|nr:helicase-related protein [Actinomycetota bacterium]
MVLPGHFTGPVRIETVEEIGANMVLARVRTSDGRPDETTLMAGDLEAALAAGPPATATVPAARLFQWIESHRIRLAYAHDPYFAVSLSGVRGLPHQIEAVYRHLLPQARLRFVLADDPGAGKTIMAGLLLKELKLRGVVDRTLVVAPAPLTVQWQDELLDKFDERFEVVSSSQVRWQLGGNPWQHYPQVVTSLDFAKRDDVAGDLLRADWDLVIIDEAHKCAAATYGDEVRKTRRYVLAEALAGRTERLLLLTATPHSGDPDRFVHFLSLLDADQFSSPELVRSQLAVSDSPYFLRRQKEDLVDETGRRLFVKRRVLTQPFTLTPSELRLYQAVTDYIGEFLGGPPPGGGRGGGNAVALARTVLQRRLASSLGAIRSSLAKRARRLEEQADALERMPPAERAKRIAELGRQPVGAAAATDDELDLDDADEDAEELAVTEVTAAAHIEGLRAEVAALKVLVAQADATIASGEEAKLAALKSCLERAELAEVHDGRGKLLIFTEHRDTLAYLERHLIEWGYSVCTIHGGHPPAQRKAIQHEFRTQKQVCVATEAAGEGINLQFCHLMVNYDLPWNPVRLEQRMGRIHRIGQSVDVVVFNFCATNTIEGKLLTRLHEKLDAMRADLDDRVYDVIGELLDLNSLDFERLLRDTLANPRREQQSLDEIDAMTPERLREYERQVGLAQARRYVDLEWVRQRDWASEERRLMPEYVEAFFLGAASAQGLRVEPRATAGLWRIEHVPVALRSDDLPAVRRLGRPEVEYRKLTFRKELRQQAEHEDSVLCSPGHPLFAALADALERRLTADGIPGAIAVFTDPGTTDRYWLHAFTYEVVGEAPSGDPETARAELVMVIQEPDGAMALAPADVLHNLTPGGDTEAEALEGGAVRAAANWIRAGTQAQATGAERDQRLAQAELRSGYLQEAFTVQRNVLERRFAEYSEKVWKGDESYRLPRDEAARRIAELDQRQRAKLEALAKLGVVRPGPVNHLGSAWVVPPARTEDPTIRAMRPDPEVELAAMEYVMAWERAQGRDPVDVSAARDGSGFDIRSLETDSATGEITVRRIEVKGRSTSSGDVGLYRTEWYAAQRFGPGYWLYVVYDAMTANPRLVTVQDPARRLAGVEEVSQVTGYRVPGASIEAAAR